MKSASDLPRDEYPQPQWQRTQWHNLNGQWDFCFDDRNVGMMEEWFVNGPFNRKIAVPFPFQSELSGIHDTSFHDIIWYRRSIEVTLEEDRRCILHFGAVDYQADVWLNGHHIAHHTGGNTPFSVDISPYLAPTPTNILVVRAEDLTHDLEQPRGKQFWEKSSRSIFYTRTSGIWQSVWMEDVNGIHLERGVFMPDIDHHAVKMTVEVSGLTPMNPEPCDLQIVISFRDETIVSDIVSVGYMSSIQRTIYLPDRVDASSRLWSPENPNIYDVKLFLLQNHQPIDEVASYFGMRKISVLGDKILLNNRPYTMKLILDQGYFPGGVLTAACDEDYVKDIDLIKKMGFNGVRKHQKVEDPRFLYWADRKGLLVWGEMANAYQFSPSAVRRFITEWQDVVIRDINHPCLVAWVPLNESWGVPEILTNQEQQAFAMSLYHLTKSLDPSRLVISNDGWEHTKTDLLTIHDYEGQESVLSQRYSSLDNTLASMPGQRALFVGPHSYQNQPVLLTEFGGIAFDRHTTEGWGYSRAVNPKMFVDRLLAVFRAANNSPVLVGYCYTQFTDVEQEVNGLLTFDRQPKIPLELILAIVDNREIKELFAESTS